MSEEVSLGRLLRRVGGAIGGRTRVPPLLLPDDDDDGAGVSSTGSLRAPVPVRVGGARGGVGFGGGFAEDIDIGGFSVFDKGVSEATATDGRDRLDERLRERFDRLRLDALFFLVLVVAGVGEYDGKDGVFAR